MTEKIKIVLDIWNKRTGYNNLLEISEPISGVDLTELLKLDTDLFRQKVDEILDATCKDLRKNLRNYFYIKKDIPNKEPINDNIYLANRNVECAHCENEGSIQIKFEYTEGGKIKSADIISITDGWDYRPFGSAGGIAPYCPACLELIDSRLLQKG